MVEVCNLEIHIVYFMGSELVFVIAYISICMWVLEILLFFFVMGDVDNLDIIKICYFLSSFILTHV